MRTKIVYEDQDILICHKPAGLATQSARIGQPDVVSELKNHLAGAYLGIVHRLDQPVEGLLVFAKNKKAAAVLTRQLEAGTLHKQYCALVYGRPPESRGELTDYLYKDGNLARVVPEGTPGAKRAVLQYMLHGVPGTAGEENPAGELPSAGGFSCLDIHIETGRFHQIRCQLAHAGMPILGDQKYGTAESLEESRRQGICQTALCAGQIRLQHPTMGREVFYEIQPNWIKP
ncbi:MAG: RluA family pseudouridine synthase [Lachnospiraceae bacterium]|nr:RluA family pseudouridine synthase [Lachnospiraceae bacterium]